MAISLSNYVSITSGVGAANSVPQRQLIARLFTDNVLLPPQSFLEFPNAAQVGAYFGTQSAEFLRAQFYFSFISKNITTPQLISFGRWVDVAVAPMIFGVAGGQSSSNYTPLSSATFGLTIGGVYNNISVNLTSAGSLAAVAADIQAAISALDPINETGTLTSSANTVSGLSSTASLAVGMPVSGTGIPANTTIASIVDATDITISNNATVSGAEALTFVPAVTGLATVAYSSANGGSFIFTGGAAPASGSEAISVQAGEGGTDISQLIGWVANASGSPIVANGSAVETLTQCLTTSAGLSTNFGSFLFMPTTPLNLAQNIEAAQWNKTQNVDYQFMVPVIPANASAWAATDGTGLGLIGGTGLTLGFTPVVVTGTLVSGSNVVTGLNNAFSLVAGSVITGTGIPAGTTIASNVSASSITLSNNATVSSGETLTVYSNQYPEMLPMMILAATNYAAPNSVQNYEFQQSAGLTPTVTDDSSYLTYTGLSINFYGQTQTAGQQLNFYQQGVLMGLPTDPLDMNTYANEQWLKDAAAVAIMNLFIALAKISANVTGRNQFLAVLQTVIDQALRNGTISVSKPLTITQQLYIAKITGDADAWHQVQNSGYWLDGEVVPVTVDGITKYQFVYTLVYSKDDIIRKVIGTHDLI